MESKSNFSSLIGTNYVATEKDRIQIMALISESTSQLALLQDEMDRVHGRFVQLQQKHAKLTRQVEDHQALMAPIRRLPIDVLQEIFLHCLPQNHGAIIDLQECPLLLTRICSGWRSIALKTPSLWASIHIPIPTSYNGHFSENTQPWLRQQMALVMAAQRRAHAVTEWLARSGGCTLDITLYENWHQRPPLEVHTTIFDALMPFAERWGTLICNIYVSNLERIAALPASAVPRLHTLILPPQRLGHHPTTFRKLQLATRDIMRAPCLRNISYSFVTEDFTEFPLRFSQLTSLRLHGVRHWESIVKLGKLLLSCPSLRHCGVDVNGQRQGQAIFDSSMPTSIPLLHLIELAVRVQFQDKDAPLLLHALDTPVLENLECNALEAEPIIPLLLRTAPTLRELTLDPLTLSYTEFVACIGQCTELLRLRFKRSNYGIAQVRHPRTQGEKIVALNDELLQLFTAPEESGTSHPLVPKLSVFECSIESQFSDAGILEFLKARLTKLKRVKFLRGQRDPECQTMEAELERLARGGVDVQLSYEIAPTQTHFPASEGVQVDPLRGPALYYIQ